MNDKVSSEKVAATVSPEIKEHKRMGENISESEQRFRCLVEGAAVGVCIIDLKGRFTYVNNAMAYLLGYSVQELLGRSFKDFLHPRDRGKIIRLFIKIIGLRRQPQNIEFRVVHKDGHILHLMSKPTRMIINGKAVGFQAIITDITERKQAEEELIRPSSAVKMSTDSIVISDLDGKIIDVNEATLKMYGTDNKGDFIGINSFDLIAPEDREKALAGMKEVLEKGYIKSREYNIIAKDGSKIPVGMSVAIIKGADGKPIGFVGISRDITERKKAEQALKESEEKFRSLVQTIPECVYSALPNGEILYMSPAVETIFGYSAEEFQKDKNLWIRLIHKDDQKELLVKLEGLLKKSIPYVYEFRMKRKDGSIVWIRDHANAMLDGKGKPTKISGIIYDITERKKAEEKLRESEEKYRNLAENLNELIYRADPETFVANYVNRAVKKIYGYTVEEWLKNPNLWEKTIHPDDKDRVFAEIVEAKRKLKNCFIEYRIVRKDKTIRWLRDHVSWEKDPKGRAVSVNGVIYDITEHKKAEEAIRESEEKYRSLFENARDVIFTGDLKGNIIDINRFVEEYGFKRDKVVGKNMLKFVSKKYWPRLLKHLAKITRGNLVEGEIEIITPKGKTIAEYRSNPIRREKKVVGFQTNLRNITERKKMEEELRQYSEQLEELVQKRTQELSDSERSYSLLVEQASDGIGISQDAKAVFVNKKLSEMLGYSKDELIGRPIFELIHEKYRQLTKEAYEKMQKERGPPTRYLETEFVAKNGTSISVELSASRTNYENRNAAMIIVRDVRERKRLEEQRLKLEKLATMGELATMVAHDLRNPLTSIRNAGYYIKNTCPYRTNTECKTTLEMLNIIEQETIFANNIINDLLDFAAKRPLQKKRQNINEIIEDSLTKGNIPRNIEVERNFKKAIIGVDEKQLERVFLNLIKNAVQAMPDGGKLAVTTKETKDNVEIIFADTGVGISEENMSKLFTPLFTTKAKGIGMGLAICKNIVEQHNGTIEVKSKVSQGTTFTIKLPKKEEAKNR
jgi:PAS domain S-box-containing protein